MGDLRLITYFKILIIPGKENETNQNFKIEILNEIILFKYRQQPLTSRDINETQITRSIEL